MTVPPDPFDLELRALGAIHDPARAAEIDAACEGPMREERLVQQAWARWWAARRPPLVLLREAAPERHWLRPALAVAAALALLIAVVSLRPPSPPPAFRAMGSGIAVDLAVVRDGQPVALPFAPRPGDSIVVRFLAPSDGFADVVVVGADGDVSVLVSGLPVVAGQRAELPGRAVLDDDRDREWLVVSIASRARDKGDAVVAARALLPDPGAAAGPDRFVLEISRGTD